jgi:hypothetical protein
MDRVSDLDRLCIAVVVFRQYTVIGGFLPFAAVVFVIFLSRVVLAGRISEPFTHHGVLRSR